MLGVEIPEMIEINLDDSSFSCEIEILGSINACYLYAERKGTSGKIALLSSTDVVMWVTNRIIVLIEMLVV